MTPSVIITRSIFQKRCLPLRKYTRKKEHFASLGFKHSLFFTCKLTKEEKKKTRCLPACSVSAQRDIFGKKNRLSSEHTKKVSVIYRRWNWLLCIIFWLIWCYSSILKTAIHVCCCKASTPNKPSFICSFFSSFYWSPFSLTWYQAFNLWVLTVMYDVINYDYRHFV